jgi:hypothetical protein
LIKLSARKILSRELIRKALRIVRKRVFLAENLLRDEKSFNRSVLFMQRRTFWVNKTLKGGMHRGYYPYVIIIV